MFKIVSSATRRALSYRNISKASNNIFYNESHNLKVNAKPFQPFRCESNSIESLSKYLQQEIAQEKKHVSDFTKFDGFTVITDGAQLIFERKHGDETVRVKCCINDSVGTIDDIDEQPEAEGADAEQPQQPSIKAKPPFHVEIERPGHDMLSFQCSIEDVSAEEMQLEQGEIPPDNELEFGIEEVAFVRDGEWSQSTYVVSTAILDSNMYDVLSAMLDQRGIDQSFVRRYVDFCTAYEHSQYVNFLEKLHKISL